MLSQRDKMFGDGEEYQMDETEKEVCRRLEEIRQEIRDGDYENFELHSVPGGFIFAFHETGPVNFDWFVREIPSIVGDGFYDYTRR